MANLNAYQQAIWDATLASLLYGHGFIRVTHNKDGVEVKHIIDEDLEDLLKFMKEQKRVEL